MKIKIPFSNLWVILLIALFFLISSGQLAALDLPVSSAILVEAETGHVIYEKNADDRRSPASITKIMTLLLSMEALDEGRISLDDIVTISDYASSMGGSQIFLGQGDIISVEELFKAVTVASANDASVALAEAVTGSCDFFIEKMNDRAKELGMDDTNFSTVHGLPQDDQYTTARDVVKMSRELIKYPQILEWGQIWTETIELPEREAMLVNTNKLILSYPEMDGLKTGYTREAGFNLAATARRGDMRLISVVLGAESKARRREVTEKLLDYGFDNYSLEKIFSEEERLEGLEIENSRPREISAKISDPLFAVTKRDGDENINYEYSLLSELNFPVTAGEKIGELHSFVDDKKMHSIDLLADQKIEKANIFRRIWYKFSDMIR